ncbi:MAG: hypothetical protein AAGI03_02120 [Pseudomonadota bacterium]
MTDRAEMQTNAIRQAETRPMAQRIGIVSILLGIAFVAATTLFGALAR